MTAASNHMRLIELRRYRVGELANEAKAAVETHVASCAECKARLSSLEEEERTFLATANVAADSAAILARLDAAPAARASRWSRVLVFAPIVALAAALAMMFLPKPPPETTRIKGPMQVALEMFVKDAEGIRPAIDGARLREGDAIQFKYQAGGRRYVFVVSVDTDGTVSPLYPDEERTSIPVAPTGTHVLEGSVILDASRGPERFFAFFSDEPIHFDEVRRALKGAERDVTRLQEVEIGREDVDEKSVLIFKE